MRRLALSLLFATTLFGCAATTQQRQTFYTILQTCSTADKANSAIKAAAAQCLASAVSGNVAGCLSSVAPGVAWTADEIECIADAY